MTKVAGLSCFVFLLVAARTTVTGAELYPASHWPQAKTPASVGWSTTRLEQAREFARTLDTAALMIVQDGLVVDQWGPVALPLKCHSVRKSLLSALYGTHVASGKIDLAATLEELGIDDNEPSLSEGEKQARVRDLLKARSGIYHPALYETRAMAAKRPPRGAHPHDTFWYYNNWDFNACATIFENLTGRSLFEEFQERLAKPMQMQDFVRTRHTRYVTGDDSVHPAYPFQLSTRDLARFGLLMLRGGKWQNEQLIPKDWVARSTRSYSDAGDAGGYGLMWWVAVAGRHFPGVELPDGSFSARGYRGHFLVIVPQRKLVIAHRVNTFQTDTSVTKSDFGKLLSMILDAAPSSGQVDARVRAPADRVEATNQNARDDPQFDTLLRGGRIIDGGGGAIYSADIALRDGLIAQIGDLSDRTARRVIDVRGKVVVPGFIDLHSHADGGLTSSDPLRRAALNLVTQGITTVVINQDGGGPESIREQRRTMQQLGIGLNVVQMIGHGTVRRSAMGEDFRRPADQEELKRMRAEIRRGMQEGARGLSAGLEYVPGRWSTAAEMKALVGELAAFRGVYIVHERSSGSHPMWFLPSRDKPDPPSMIDNLQELIDVARTTGVTVVATHIKARGEDFWGSSRVMIDMIEKARAEGLSVFADQYAYNTSGSDGRIVLIPNWVFQQDPTEDAQPGKLSPAERLEQALADPQRVAQVHQDISFEITRRGGADNIIAVEHLQPDYVGKSLAELSSLWECDAVAAAIRLQVKGDRTRRGGARLRAFSMSERDVEAFAATPWTATSSDAGIALPTDGPVHPRFYGAFPRKIRHYALDRGALRLEEAIRVSTSLPASILELDKRGTLAVGAVADIVVFDPQTIRDTADAFQPHRYCEGIDYVLIGGQVAVQRGRYLGKLAGRVIGSADGQPE